MVPQVSTLLSLLAASILQVAPVTAGFNPNSKTNLAIYWGQNSYNQPTGNPLSQQRLSYYCQNSNINIIPLAFVNIIVNPTNVNFANAGDRCSTFPGTTLLQCPEIEADIKTCQSLGKTIVLSLGGATYTEGGFPSAAAANSAADKLWAMFGPVQSGSTVNRPFGTAVVDGFDLDFEAVTNNLLPFAQRLRSSMDSGGRKFYLTAAPQCVYPDAAMNSALSGAVAFDFVMVQFYNNWCGVQNYQPGSETQTIFNMAEWDRWATTVSANRAVKVLLGVPGNAGAGGGYQPAANLAPIINYCKRFASFGGVMIWDMSQTYANGGFLDGVAAALGGAGPTPTSTLATSTRTTTAPTTTPTGPLVPQWGQCGGRDYTGPTQCQPPYRCVFSSEWWSSCQ